MERKPNLIFLCIGNSARSQMAEAFMKSYAKEHFNIYSAGFEAKPIYPLTYEVMGEKGYSLKDQTSKNLSEFLGKKHFGIVITVCARAEERCPTMPGVGTRKFWNLDDPAVFEGSEEEKRNKFREIRDQLENHVKNFLKERNLL